VHGRTGHIGYDCSMLGGITKGVSASVFVVAVVVSTYILGFVREIGRVCVDPARRTLMALMRHLAIGNERGLDYLSNPSSSLMSIPLSRFEGLSGGDGEDVLR